MTPGAMRLKANLRNSSARTGIPAQLLLQDFFPERFAKAFRATVAHRGSADRIGNPVARLADFAASDSLRGEWEKYRRRFRYAADITFDQTLDALRTVLAMIR